MQYFPRNDHRLSFYVVEGVSQAPVKKKETKSETQTGAVVHKEKSVNVPSCLHGKKADRGVSATTIVAASYAPFYHYSFFNSALLSGRPKLEPGK